MVRLSGTGLIADDLYLMAHNDVTGRPFLRPRAAGLGLAGGLLAELALADNICLPGGWLMAGDQPLPRDELARSVLRLVVGEGEARATRDWLAFVARGAVTNVATRLERSGYLARAERRPRRADIHCLYEHRKQQGGTNCPEHSPPNPDAAIGGLPAIPAGAPRYFPVPDDGQAVAEGMHITHGRRVRGMLSM